MTATLEGGEWSEACPSCTLPPGKTRYPFYRRLGGPQGRSGQAENPVPTGIWSQTVQPVVSRYTDWATRPHIVIYTDMILTVHLLVIVKNIQNDTTAVGRHVRPPTHAQFYLQFWLRRPNCAKFAQFCLREVLPHTHSYNWRKYISSVCNLDGCKTSPWC
jgi:hypothetical protein